MNDSASELRRQRRRRLADSVVVIDSMTGQAIGRLGNLSEAGMLLMADAPLVDDAVYQLRFDLHDADFNVLPIELGAHLLWQDAANTSGQTISGLRIINVSDPQRQTLREWLDQPGGSYA